MLQYNIDNTMGEVFHQHFSRKRLNESRRVSEKSVCIGRAVEKLAEAVITFINAVVAHGLWLIAL